MQDRSHPAVEVDHLASLADYSGAPWTSDNPYFVEAEPHMAWLWDHIVWPFIAECDFTNVIDLAAGQGRNTVFLLNVSGHVTVMDIQDGNVRFCRNRFEKETKLSFIKNNGYDFHPVGADTASLVYCFDAMVHFDSDVVRSYLRDAHRVLRAGGKAFFHHSNYTGGQDWRTNPGSRNFMSKEFFGHYALKERFNVLRQSVINWGGDVGLDCLSLLEKPV